MGYWLVVEPPPLKNISQNGNLPQIGVKNGENKKYLKPPPRICYSNHTETETYPSCGRQNATLSRSKAGCTCMYVTRMS